MNSSSTYKCIMRLCVICAVCRPLRVQQVEEHEMTRRELYEQFNESLPETLSRDLLCFLLSLKWHAKNIENVVNLHIKWKIISYSIFVCHPRSNHKLLRELWEFEFWVRFFGTPGMSWFYPPSGGGVRGRVETCYYVVSREKKNDREKLVFDRLKFNFAGQPDRELFFPYN